MEKLPIEKFEIQFWCRRNSAVLLPRGEMVARKEELKGPKKAITIYHRCTLPPPAPAVRSSQTREKEAIPKDVDDDILISSFLCSLELSAQSLSTSISIISALSDVRLISISFVANLNFSSV